MVMKRDDNRGWGRWPVGKLALTTGLGLACGLAGSAAAQRGEIEFQLQAQAVELEVIGGGGDVPTDDDFLNAKPGFDLRTDEDLTKRIAAFNKQLESRDWGKAFRLLTDLGDDRLDTMVPIGDDGLYMGVQVQVQKSLLAMPPDGRRAFQLYFDGQAREMLAEVRDHPLPGSDDQLALARKLVDRMLASSVGGEAAELLGDLHFERGQFAQARRSWQLALDHGSAAAQDELQLQAKIVMATLRGGDRSAANNYFQQLSARYDRAGVTLGGEDVDALETLGALLRTHDAPGPAGAGESKDALKLPNNGVPPAWHLGFINDATRARYTTDSNQNRYYYRGIQDLQAVVPEVVADGDQVYFQWLGTVFALNQQTGKINWIQGSLTDSAQSVNERMSSNGGDPRNYRITQSQNNVLATFAARTGGFSQFKVTAYDKQDGRQAWDSMFHGDWSLAEDGVTQNDTSVAGQVLVAGDAAYAVVHRATGADCYLRRFDPGTGAVAWTLPLGAADPITFQYTDMRRMPQPLMMLSDGLLYVLMNNGSLIAVDVAGVEIAWARRLEAPMGVGQIARNSRVNVNAFEAMNNPNGAGSLLMHDRTLYAKEHLGKQMVAIDPVTGALDWSIDTLEPDTKLIGIDDERLYLMNEGLQSYWLKGDHARAETNNNDMGGPKHAGALLLGDQLLAITANRNEASGRLRLFDTGTLDKQTTYEMGDYFGPNGGRLYRYDDLLICIDQNQITAVRLDADEQASQ